MIFTIKEEHGNITIQKDYSYNLGLQLIDNVREGLEQRNIEERVINELDSIKDFWNSSDFYSTPEEREPYLILRGMLDYFLDKRKKKFLDCEEKVQNLFRELEVYLIDKDDVEVMKGEIIQDSYGETATKELFFKNINCRIRKLEIADKYTGSDHKEEISRYKFVENTVKGFGTSDSYMAQCLYRKLDRYRGEKCEANDGVPGIIVTLEIYRCIVKKSTAKENELLAKYNPWNR